MRKKWISVVLFCMIAVCCTAQTAGYKFYSELDSVKTSGFYNIAITPELSAHLKTDYSDLRIVNDSGKWIPHVLHYPLNEVSNDIFHFDLKYTKPENNKIRTSLIIENSQNIISNIGLIINNTLAERFCTLSGSNDSKNWFIINDSILINPEPVETGIANTFLINFPPCNYKFYKIIIRNNNKDPFDIIRIVNQTSAIIKSPYQDKIIQNPTTSIQQKDSGKISYIKITQQQAFHFSGISLKLDGVKYFSRNVELYIPSSSNHSFSNPGQRLQNFTVSNNSTLQFNVPLVNATIFYLLIHNEDNLPLKVAAINTSIDYRYITSYLEKGNKYKLIMGNISAIKPNYDLASINTKFSDSTPILAFKKIAGFEEKPVIVTPQKNNTWILWAAIIAVLIVLLLFTRKMMTEVNKRKEHDTAA
ncbi:hypothetical protein [Ferruginibacter sp. SUN106]|uniref:hypothetical protein n=1 Tax=Ferruginibacter sp. SUN106 TaxID=2978348 RepID=UPI003D361214